MAEKTTNEAGSPAEKEQTPATSEQKNRRMKDRRSGRNRNRPEASINMDELRELIDLVKENALVEFELEHHGYRVRLRREEAGTGAARERAPFAAAQATAPVAEKSVAPPSQSTVPSTVVHPGASAESAASEDQDLHIIPSPIVGTFYRSPSPNADSFVKIGSTVEPETVVCIIEAMKLMNEIQAETAGEVAKIYVENGQPVEYGQPLFGIKK